ncbi:MAG: acyl-CoA synthetase FdrA [Firmicutes bacterium]|nr:acyl-CoA synthetase FdrA [Bacillota bacterium]MDH7495672.1 acyl-CoA synthetase FdrA [Bacillota bacterium]
MVLRRLVIEKNAYHDSVVLMSLTQEIQRLHGIEGALVGMATDLNKDSARALGFGDAEMERAGPGDLIIALTGDDAGALDEAEKRIASRLERKARARERASGEEALYPSLAEVPIRAGGIAAISVPGAYAAREAREALRRGLHVFLFSDNVSLEDELALKQMGLREGLLVMGPDCGTAVIGGVGLGFANKVRPGRIGIVAASGTGLQQVLAVIDELGEGITNAIGTGGRDLRNEIGGITTLMGLDILEKDDSTKVKVLISKPPHDDVRLKVIDFLEKGSKPAVVCFMGDEGHAPGGAATCSDRATVAFAGSLEEAAAMACSLASEGVSREIYPQERIEALARDLAALQEPQVSDVRMSAAHGASPRYLRGLYGGGTLCEETLAILARAGVGVYSNATWLPEFMLEDPETSRAHTCIDMGDDYFTRGRPHPMLEPGLRVPRYLREARDPEVGILLFDVVLGYGCHPDPAGVMAEAVREAAELAAREKRPLIQIAVLVGTSGDPQGLSRQEKVLRDAGATVLSSNRAAARLVALMLERARDRAGEAPGGVLDVR